MAYYLEEMKPGMLHDHMDMYSVKFWYTKEDGYRGTKTITLYIEHDESWDKIAKVLKKKYKEPEIISVKYHG